MRGVTAAVAVGAWLVGIMGAAPARAAFEIVDQQLAYSEVTGLATFTLLFNQAPDFETVDEFDRPRNSFQYEVDLNWDGDPARQFDFESIGWVFRGDEVRFGGTVPIRAGQGGDGSPESGGWGPVKDVAPIVVDGTRATFTVDFGALGESDDLFRYRVFALEYGTMTNVIDAAYVPLPPAVLIGAVGLAASLAARRTLRRA
jgi:hypothetical protein